MHPDKMNTIAAQLAVGISVATLVVITVSFIAVLVMN